MLPRISRSPGSEAGGSGAGGWFVSILPVKRGWEPGHADEILDIEVAGMTRASLMCRCSVLTESLAVACAGVSGLGRSAEGRRFPIQPPIAASCKFSARRDGSDFQALPALTRAGVWQGEIIILVHQRSKSIICSCWLFSLLLLFCFLSQSRSLLSPRYPS